MERLLPMCPFPARHVGRIGGAHPSMDGDRREASRRSDRTRQEGATKRRADGRTDADADGPIAEDAFVFVRFLDKKSVGRVKSMAAQF